MSKSIFNGLTATGNSYSPEFAFSGDATVIVSGTFGGGTFQLQVKQVDGTWVPVDGSDTSTPVAKNVSLCSVNMRGALLGAATAPNLIATLSDL